MAESRVRKNAKKKLQQKRRAEAREQRQETARLAPGGRSWAPYVFIPLALLGVLWMVVWNLAGSSIGFMQSLGNWNLAIGIGLIIASFFFATLWK